MRARRVRWSRAWAWASALIPAVAVLATGQEARPKAPADPKANPDVNARAAGARRGGLRLPGGAPPRRQPLEQAEGGVADPFAEALARAKGAGKAPLAWPYRYTFRLLSHDGTPLSAVYYPAQRGAAPVVLLLHERGRLKSDFEDPIEDLKDEGLAGYLQAQGYAVVALDLRGHGANARRELGPQDRAALVGDLQATYHVLIDRHNREELNLARFGVVALAESAPLVVAWAAQPGAAVSSEGRLGDLQALVLVSPPAEGFGIRLAPSLASIAPRIPMLLMAGERDEGPATLLKEAGPILERQRRCKVETFPTSLHGYKLLRYQPKVPDSIAAFLETSVKRARAGEWEPRYNLTPVVVRDVFALKVGEDPPSEAKPPAEAKPAAEKAAPK